MTGFNLNVGTTLLPEPDRWAVAGGGLAAAAVAAGVAVCLVVRLRRWLRVQFAPDAKQMWVDSQYPRAGAADPNAKGAASTTLARVGLH